MMKSKLFKHNEPEELLETETKQNSNNWKMFYNGSKTKNGTLDVKK